MARTKRFGIDVEAELLEKFRKEVRKKDWYDGKIRQIIEAAMQMFIEHGEIVYPPPNPKKK